MSYAERIKSEQSVSPEELAVFSDALNTKANEWFNGEPQMITAIKEALSEGLKHFGSRLPTIDELRFLYTKPAVKKIHMATLDSSDSLAIFKVISFKELYESAACAVLTHRKQNSSGLSA